MYSCVCVCMCVEMILAKGRIIIIFALRRKINFNLKALNVKMYGRSER